MIYLFFDTETTGLPKNYNAPSSDLEKMTCHSKSDHNETG